VSGYLEVRPWRSDDLAAWRESALLYSSPTYQWRIQSWHCTAVESGRQWIGQVALHGEQVVALAECGWVPADRESPTLAVNVADMWQTSGIARRTLRELIRRCLALGLTTFRLDHFASNVALDFLADTVAAEMGLGYSMTGVTRSGLGYLALRSRQP